MCLSASPDESSMEVVKLEDGEKIINSFVGLQEKKMVGFCCFGLFLSLRCLNYEYGTKILDV